MRDLVFTNFQAKLLSLLAATFLWFTIHLSTPPEVAFIERDFPGLPIRAIRASEDANSHHIEPWTAQVRLRGEPSVMQNLREEQIEVFVNLSDIKKETKGLRKRLQVYLPEGIRLMSIDPEEVTVESLPAVPAEKK